MVVAVATRMIGAVFSQKERRVIASIVVLEDPAHIAVDRERRLMKTRRTLSAWHQNSMVESGPSAAVAVRTTRAVFGDVDCVVLARVVVFENSAHFGFDDGFTG